jgi:hypothetical protein
MTGAAEIAAQRLQLIDAGWRPVPASPADKSCQIVGWPSIEPTEHFVENWARTHPAHTLTSIVCGQHIVALDLDVLDAERADQVQAAAFRHLGVTGFIRVGVAPKRLLVYRQPYTAPRVYRQNGHATPASIRSETYRFADSGALIEILSTGRLFVGFGIHPDTGLPYRWIGDATPLEDTPTDAPLITQEQVEAFIAAVHAEIAPLVIGATGNPSAVDAKREVNADGLVTDGRENLLRDCVFRAANEVHARGDALTPQGVGARGWELFVARAWLADGKWQEKHALTKARVLVRRINAGRVTLANAADKLREAAITYPNIDQDKNTNRETLRLLLTKFVDLAINTFHRGESS